MTAIATSPVTSAVLERATTAVAWVQTSDGHVGVPGIMTGGEPGRQAPVFAWRS